MSFFFFYLFGSFLVLVGIVRSSVSLSEPMGTPEFPDLGKHCSVDICKQIDFLPFTCDRCLQVPLSLSLFWITCKKESSLLRIVVSYDCLNRMSSILGTTISSSLFFCRSCSGRTKWKVSVFFLITARKIHLFYMRPVWFDLFRH